MAGPRLGSWTDSRRPPVAVLATGDASLRVSMQRWGRCADARDRRAGGGAGPVESQGIGVLATVGPGTSAGQGPFTSARRGRVGFGGAGGGGRHRRGGGRGGAGAVGAVCAEAGSGAGGDGSAGLGRGGGPGRAGGRAGSAGVDERAGTGGRVGVAGGPGPVLRASTREMGEPPCRAGEPGRPTAAIPGIKGSWVPVSDGELRAEVIERLEVPRGGSRMARPSAGDRRGARAAGRSIGLGSESGAVEPPAVRAWGRCHHPAAGLPRGVPPPAARARITSTRASPAFAAERNPCLSHTPASDPENLRDAGGIV